MYCELTGKKPAPITFLSPTLTISGKFMGLCVQKTTCHWPLHCLTWNTFCVFRLPYAGGVAIPGPEGHESGHQQPRWVLHPAGPRPVGKWTDLRALHCPAALLPLPKLCIPSVMLGWSDEPPSLSFGERCAIMGSPRWGVHQAVLPGQSVLERSHGPTHWPAQQTGARKDLQAAWHTHISQW